MGLFKRRLLEQIEFEASERGEREPTDPEWDEFYEREERMMREYEAECEAKKLRLVFSKKDPK